MNTKTLTATLPTLFAELLDGAPLDEAYMINRGDPGLLIGSSYAIGSLRKRTAGWQSCATRARSKRSS